MAARLDPVNRRRVPHRLLPGAVLAAVAVIAAACTPAADGVIEEPAPDAAPVAAPEPAPPAAAPGPDHDPEPAPDADRSPAPAARQDPEMRWKKIRRLEDEQKYEAAAEAVAELLADARRSGDQESWARALVRTIQLRTALHGYETAVRLFREEKWPEDPRWHPVLELFYAHGLVNYLDAYSWEIRQREAIERSGEVDLAQWTLAQIAAEADAAFARVWERREEWGDRGVGLLGEYLEANSYPQRIRGTLRDTVTYLWVELLANTSLWRPEDSNRLFRLSLDRLLSLEPGGETHPLARLTALLADLEDWHRESGRSEAAFEARLERLRRLHGSFARDDDRRSIQADLRHRLDELGDEHPWWSMGQAQLAEMVRQGGDRDHDSQIEAREIALAGARRHPGSIGGKRCRHLVESIEAPSFSLAAMQVDGPGKRSLAVRHRNVERLHLRAYAVDLERHVTASRDYSLLPADQEIQALVAGATPVAEWSADLPATPDYREHRTYLTPPLDEPGLYVVVASVRPDFRRDGNHMVGLDFIVSDLVLVTRPGERRLDVTVRSGASGQPVPGAEVSLYRFDYRGGHRRAGSRRTGSLGGVSFSAAPRERFFLVARKDGDVVVDSSALRAQSRTEAKRRNRAFIYTDRSIYRPLQRIEWKVIAYGGKEASYRTLPERELSVELVDANGETVAEVEVMTNAFGSASGGFEVPAGRLLGRWRLRTSIGGATVVRVEEYKRPTFEVELGEPEEALRLNRTAELAGSAHYYFGLPVVDGEVAWRVTREPVYPYWWRWYFPARRNATEVVATGATTLDENGVFRVGFTPAADEREAGTGVSYRYRLSADVTETGGETRSAERVFTLGFVAVRAVLDAEKSFFTAGSPARFTLTRTDLDGVPRPGEASWRVTRLAQPERALLPAEQPLPVPPPKDDEPPPFTTPGDHLRPRWQSGLDARQVMRSWEDGEEVAAGGLAHGADGTAPLEIAALAPGAYRLRYETADPFGATFADTTDFIVAAAGSTPLALPAVMMTETGSVAVGGTARILVHSGLADQDLELAIFRAGAETERHRLSSADGLQLVEIPITRELRGGFGVRLTALRDHQMMLHEASVLVPWDDRRLAVEFSTFRDRLRPGTRETWRVTVRSEDEEVLAVGSSELLAYMYDRSLDLFGPHRPPDPLGLYPSRVRFDPLRVNLGAVSPVWSRGRDFVTLSEYPHLSADRLVFLDAYGVGGPGRRTMARMAVVSPPVAMELSAEAAPPDATGESSRVTSSLPDAVRRDDDGRELDGEPGETAPEGAGLRTDFAETAFWEPHLVLDDDGSVAFEFEVPDSVTEWNVWLHALTTDLRSGRLEKRARSVKELLVRPSLPRFLREGDRAELRVVVNNAGDEALAGTLDFRIEDPETGADLGADFGLDPAAAGDVVFTVEPSGSTTLEFPVVAPSRVGEVAFRVTGTAGGYSDGELRPLPVLPGRMHLLQSRFVTLSEADRRVMTFEDLAADDDPTRIDDRLVVTLDTQLFYGVLNALPYLVDYPYECTEQTLNRFLSTGILSSLFDRYPAVAAMAETLSQRDTRLETWNAADPNRKMALEETPWLVQSRGGGVPEEDLVRVLDPRIARAERREALAKLEKAQTSLGGFPWWPGGPPSPYMTLYILGGFSRALEFDVEVPRDLVVRAWAYMHRHYVDELVREAMGRDCCWGLVTLLNYVLSSYPDDSWTGGVFTGGERATMLEFSFKHWKEHSPRLKALLALTLDRTGRSADAKLLLDSIMDSARTTRDEGTFWAPEDRAWLWYNDTVESHAFILRALTELEPGDARRHGLVQWLLLNKKLNHWKSTRATAEVVYSLAHYLEHEGTLGAREAVDVTVGARRESFVFEPDEYTGRNNQLVLVGEEIDPATSSTIVVEKETPGLAFASATWHFSTEELPEEARGDFFSVEREYFRRVHDGGEWKLEPLAEGATLAVGDQVEVRLSIRAKHAAEYVHLRDPRPAGFEPETLTSAYKHQLGLGFYEEVRDSGANFFFEWLPVGELTFKYRLRATVAGTFKAGPATLQSMYAPEFAGYSAGDALTIGR